MHIHIEGNRNFQQRMTLNFTIKYKAIITLSVTRWMVDLLYTKVCHFSNKYHNGLKSPLLWNVCIIRLPRSNLILQKTIEIFLVRDTVLNARINSFYSFYFILLEKNHIDQENKYMIMKETSADSLGLRKTCIQYIIYFLLMFSLKTTQRITQADFDICFTIT